MGYLDKRQKKGINLFGTTQFLFLNDFNGFCEFEVRPYFHFSLIDGAESSKGLNFSRFFKNHSLKLLSQQSYSCHAIVPCLALLSRTRQKGEGDFSKQFYRAIKTTRDSKSGFMRRRDKLFLFLPFPSFPCPPSILQ
jgi:hypothetical protein